VAENREHLCTARHACRRPPFATTCNHMKLGPPGPPACASHLLVAGRSTLPLPHVPTVDSTEGGRRAGASRRFAEFAVLPKVRTRRPFHVRCRGPRCLWGFQGFAKRIHRQEQTNLSKPAEPGWRRGRARQSAVARSSFAAGRPLPRVALAAGRPLASTTTRNPPTGLP
jgi:hypothetical protein